MDYLDRVQGETETRTEYQQWRDAVVAQDDFETNPPFGVPIFRAVPVFCSTYTDNRPQVQTLKMEEI